MNRKAHAFSTLLLLAALSTCSSRDDATGPNLVIVTLDTFRVDRVGTFGNEDGLTPNLDRIAEEATRFPRALTPIGTTHPAHASLFTGLYPGEHGVRFNGDVLDDDVTTLAELLRDAGYRTAAFVAKKNMIVRGGLQQGFDVRSDDAPDGGPRIRPGDAVNELALDWLDAAGDGPFFLWVHYFETHTPLRNTTYARERLGRYDGPLKNGAPTELVYDLGTDRLPDTPANRRALAMLYDGEVLEADRLVGDVYAKLRALGRLDDTIVVVAADHGELLGEHGEVGHGFHVLEPVLRVPLMIREPKQTEPRDVERRVSLVDVLPTLAELLGLPPPETSGRSLVRLLRGHVGPPVPYFASVRAPNVKRGGAARGQDVQTVAVYRDRFKLVLTSERADLFDLSDDPGEFTPLTGEAAAAVREKLLPLALEHRRRERPDASPIALPADVLEELREQGYIR